MQTLYQFCSLGQRFSVGRMARPQLLDMYKMVTSQNWGLTLRDYQLIYDAFPNDFYGAFCDKGNLISTYGMTSESPNLACASVFITNPQYKKQKIGLKMVKYCLENELKERILVADATTGVGDVYKRYFESKYSGLNVNELMCYPSVRILDEMDEDPGILVEPITPAHMDALCQYQQTIAGFDRSTLMKLWVLAPDSISLQAVDRHSKSVIGYVTARECPTSTPSKPVYKAAGFYADNEMVAKQLLLCLFRKHLGSSLVQGVCFWSDHISMNQKSAESVISAFGPTNQTMSIPRMTFGGDLPQLGWKQMYGMTKILDII